MALPLENPMVASVLPLIPGYATGDDPGSLPSSTCIGPPIVPSHKEPRVRRQCRRGRGLARAFRLKSKRALAKVCITTPHGSQSDAAFVAPSAILLMDVSCPYGATFGSCAKELELSWLCSRTW